MVNLNAEGPIGYTAGLIIAALLFVILWGLRKLEEKREKVEREKELKELEKIEL